MRRLTITIDDAVARALADAAAAERRRPQDQAAFVLERQLLGPAPVSCPAPPAEGSLVPAERAS